MVRKQSEAYHILEAVRARDYAFWTIMCGCVRDMEYRSHLDYILLMCQIQYVCNAQKPQYVYVVMSSGGMNNRKRFSKTALMNAFNWGKISLQLILRREHAHHFFQHCSKSISCIRQLKATVRRSVADTSAPAQQALGQLLALAWERQVLFTRLKREPNVQSHAHNTLYVDLVISCMAGINTTYRECKSRGN